MGKVKIHEIAKKLGLSSKEVIDKAKELGIDAKSHLSILEDNDAKKLEESLGKTKKENPDKNSSPVIIRRQVIMNNESKKEEEVKTEKPHEKSGVGFVESQRKKDYNIVYRNRPTKPLTVSELFGMSKKEDKKTTTTTSEPKEEKTSGQGVNPAKEVSSDKTINITNRPFNKDKSAYNNQARPFNKDARNNTQIIDHIITIITDMDKEDL